MLRWKVKWIKKQEHENIDFINSGKWRRQIALLLRDDSAMARFYELVQLHPNYTVSTLHLDNSYRTLDPEKILNRTNGLRIFWTSTTASNYTVVVSR